MRFTLRKMMVLIAIIGFDTAIISPVVRFRDPDHGKELLAIVAFVVASFNVIIYNDINITINVPRTAPNEQGGQILTLGCLLCVFLMLAVPVLFVLLLQ